MVNILRLSVAYLNATINVKPEMLNRSLEPTGVAKPGETRMLTVTGLGLAHQQSAYRVFGRVWNGTDGYLQSEPGLLAGHPNLLLTRSTCCMTKNFTKRYTTWEYWAVEWRYLFIKKSLAGEMPYSVASINFGRLGEARARIFLGLALPTGWIRIGQKGNDKVWITSSTIIDVSRKWLCNN
jgi:hypothetical protein